MKLLDGKKISQLILADIQRQVKKLPLKPVFCDVLIGDDPVSRSYVLVKGKAAQQVGVEFKLCQYPENISENELLEEIKKLNSLAGVCGIIIQMPLPPKFQRQQVLDAIDPDKDVDCLTTVNAERFYKGQASLVPPTAAAVMELLFLVPGDLSTKKFVVVGQGVLVGKPVGELLKRQNYDVAVADSSTGPLFELTKSADVLICGTGKAGIITGDLVKPGAVVIDAGTAEIEGGIVGDVDFESVSRVAGFLSPVPGGVGPLTVAKLLGNVLITAKKIYGQ